MAPFAATEKIPLSAPASVSYRSDRSTPSPFFAYSVKYHCPPASSFSPYRAPVPFSHASTYSTTACMVAAMPASASAALAKLPLVAMTARLAARRSNETLPSAAVFTT